MGATSFEKVTSFFTAFSAPAIGAGRAVKTASVTTVPATSKRIDDLIFELLSFSDFLRRSQPAPKYRLIAYAKILFIQALGGRFSLYFLSASGFHGDSRHGRRPAAHVDGLGSRPV